MNKKILPFFFLLLISVLSLSFSKLSKPKQQYVKTIIIDAGHGGRDAGAKGVYSYEKDICLAISIELQKQMAAAFPEIKFVMTRTTDSYPALHTRAKMANENKGDLFISIHVNAAPPKKVKEFVGNKTITTYQGKGANRKKVSKTVPQYKYRNIPNPAKGTETYIWGAHKNEDKEVAMRENAPLFEEDNKDANYGGIDPNSPEFIAFSLLKTKQYFRRSATFANLIQEEFGKIGRIDRDVRQRSVGIWVLQATAMPSVLVETGYITNKSEEDYLNSKQGQAELAQSITKAVAKYIEWLKTIELNNSEKEQRIALQENQVLEFLYRQEENEKQRKSFALN